ncbi:MAG: phosphate acyltransferase PlsX, partial [Candidatus Dormibacteraceae bacterium]
ADVVVADGLLGNVTIKMAEAAVEMILTALRREVPRTIAGKVGGVLISSAVRRIRQQLDWREYGGAPLMGINGVAVVAHGRSDARAIRSAIRVAMQTSEAGLGQSIREALAA